MLQINTKYKIQDKELAATLETIEKAGYNQAFSVALQSSISIAAADAACTLATTYLAWSHNLLMDSRLKADPLHASNYRVAAQFYRKLAHRVYWFQLKNDLIAPIKDFIQSIGE